MLGTSSTWRYVWSILILTFHCKIQDFQVACWLFLIILFFWKFSHTMRSKHFDPIDLTSVLIQFYQIFFDCLKMYNNHLRTLSFQFKSEAVMCRIEYEYWMHIFKLGYRSCAKIFLIFYYGIPIALVFSNLIFSQFLFLKHVLRLFDSSFQKIRLKLWFDLKNRSKTIKESK